MRVGVIGAGPSGLVTAKVLKHDGFMVVRRQGPAAEEQRYDVDFVAVCNGVLPEPYLPECEGRRALRGLDPPLQLSNASNGACYASGGTAATLARVRGGPENCAAYLETPLRLGTYTRDPVPGSWP